MTEQQPVERHSSAPVRAGLAALLLAVLALVLLVRPGGAEQTDAGPAEDGSSPSAVVPSATPSVPPGEESFCREYRRMAAARSEYDVNPDEGGYDILRESADRLLATGVPRSMSITALGGLHRELTDVYTTLGLTLDPDAVPGAAEASGLEGADEDFGAYLRDFCPGW